MHNFKSQKEFHEYFLKPENTGYSKATHTQLGRFQGFLDEVKQNVTNFLEGFQKSQWAAVEFFEAQKAEEER